MYKDPFSDCDQEAVKKHETQKQRAVPTKIGGGNAAGVAPGRFSTLSDVNTIITAMKRE
jgi:hypothetical protein